MNTKTADMTASGDSSNHSRTSRALCSSFGAGTWTVPLASAVTIVSCSPGAKARVAAYSARAGVDVERHGACEPVGPSKHATAVTPPFTITVADAARIGTDQSPPVAFQKSSSWSPNAFRAPRTS